MTATPEEQALALATAAGGPMAKAHRSMDSERRRRWSVASNELTNVY